MKKLIRVLSFVMLMAIVAPLNAAGSTVNPTPTEDPRVQQLVQRLNEIREISKSELSRSERKELRKEVREIRKEMKTIKGGVYLSVGAIIIIILVLILIL